MIRVRVGVLLFAGYMCVLDVVMRVGGETSRFLRFVGGKIVCGLNENVLFGGFDCIVVVDLELGLEKSALLSRFVLYEKHCAQK